MTSKHHRARLHLALLLAAAEENGIKCPPRMMGAAKPDILVEIDKRWRARISHDCRVAYAMQSAKSVGETFIREPGATLLVFEVFGDRKLIINHCESEAEPYMFVPGLWEAWFGIDNERDTSPLLPHLFADPSEASWRDFMDSADGAGVAAQMDRVRAGWIHGDFRG